ncbi:MAG: HNH endonuclease signature motif containing protein [Pseudomonadota bacterium]|nr:HNH endonuclease signature motif containing protein [Pseudomonadota bacterium]
MTRNKFRKIRKRFMLWLVRTHKSQLLAAGLTNYDLRKMREGYVPAGYNVHHKLPISGGGTNSFSNLCLIPIFPHNQIHKYIFEKIWNLVPGDRKILRIPWPVGEFISPETIPDVYTIAPPQKPKRSRSRQRQTHNIIHVPSERWPRAGPAPRGPL